jgi:hypothetical protein
MLLVDFNSLLKSQVIIELAGKICSDILQRKLTAITQLPLENNKSLYE